MYCLQLVRGYTIPVVSLVIVCWVEFVARYVDMTNQNIMYTPCARRHPTDTTIVMGMAKTASHAILSTILAKSIRSLIDLYVYAVTSKVHRKRTPVRIMSFTNLQNKEPLAEVVGGWVGRRLTCTRLLAAMCTLELQV